MSRHPELLIPASSLEVLKTAVIFGADAVYIEEKLSVLEQKRRIFQRKRCEKEFNLPMSMV